MSLANPEIVGVEKVKKMPELGIRDPIQAQNLLADKKSNFEEVLKTISGKVQGKFEGYVYTSAKDIAKMTTALGRVSSGLNKRLVALSQTLASIDQKYSTGGASADVTGDIQNKLGEISDARNKLIGDANAQCKTDCEDAYEFVQSGGNVEKGDLGKGVNAIQDMQQSGGRIGQIENQIKGSI